MNWLHAASRPWIPPNPTRQYPHRYDKQAYKAATPSRGCSAVCRAYAASQRDTASAQTSSCLRSFYNTWWIN